MALLAISPVFAREDARIAQIEEVGANHRVIKFTPVPTDESAGDEAELSEPRHVIEIGTGMNFWDGTNWVSSDPTFDLTDAGFEAPRLQFKVRIKGQINQPSAVTLTTSDGKVLRSTPVAIGLYDAESGQSQIISAITNAAGTLVGTNQVVFENAFSGVAASIVYTIQKESFEQDLVISDKLDPEDFGFPRESTRIQIYTEFYDPPEPERTRRPLRVEAEKARRDRMAAPDLVDEVLEFGTIVFTTGRAYRLTDQPMPKNEAARVAKEFRARDGRTFLIESVEYPAVEEKLQAAVLRDANQNRRSFARMIPSPNPASVEKPELQIAKADYKMPRGILIDYLATAGSTTNVYRGDTTYLVSGNVINNGGVTIEAGAVFKFKYDANGYYLKLNGPLTCKGQAYRPIFFTGVDDDSVGDSMSTYANSGYDANGLATKKYGKPALWLDYSGNANLSHVRFRYAQDAVWFDEAHSYGATLSHSQFVKCIRGIVLTGSGSGTGTFIVKNALFADLDKPVEVNNNCPSAFYNCTFASPGTRVFTATASTTATFVNSIFANVATLYSGTVTAAGNNNGFYNYSGVAFGNAATRYTVSSSPFNSSPVGFGNYYLTGSDFRDVGTTTGLGALADELKLMSTVAPSTLGSVSVAQTKTPVTNLRDTGVPDLGYHYEALDYIVENGTLSAELKVEGGVAVGVKGNRGFLLATGGAFSSTGTPRTMNRVVSAANVQDNGGVTPANTAGGRIFLELNSNIGEPSIAFRFSEVSIGQGTLGWLLFAGAQGGFPANLTIRDSFLNNVQIKQQPVTSSPCFAEVRNNIFLRSKIEFSHASWGVNTPFSVSLYNNLFLNTPDAPDSPGTPPALSLKYDSGTSNPDWHVKDNLFDKAEQIVDVDVNLLSKVSKSHNAFTTGTGDSGLTAQPSSDNQTGFTVVYATGPLGKFYIPTSAAKLIKKGSRSAAAAGLFHHTTRLDQQKKGFSTVDIGFHYVALNGTTATSTPIDTTPADSVADYFADTDGDGQVDTGETAWFNHLGEWSVPFNMYGNAIHSVMMPNGKLLYFAGTFARIYTPTNDVVPQAEVVTPPTNGAQYTPTDLALINTVYPPASYPHYNIFCGGQTLLPNGSVVVASGTLPWSESGPRNVGVYSPVTDFWTQLPPMSEGRWYPTCTALDTGEILITAGGYATSDANGPFHAQNELPEVWNPRIWDSGSQAGYTTRSEKMLPLYPFIFASHNQSGAVFMPGPGRHHEGVWEKTSAFLTPAAWGNGAVFKVAHYDAPAVMFEPGKVLQIGGRSSHGITSGYPPHQQVEMIDLTTTGTWGPAENPPHAKHLVTGRMHHNATLLADGTVLVTGGHNGSLFNPAPQANAATRKAELWGPAYAGQDHADWTWTELAEGPIETFGNPPQARAYYRGYHSSAVLLPDGRVLTAGGDYSGFGEIFRPPYLARMSAAGRPIITGAPARVTHGEVFQVYTSSSTQVEKVTLVALSAVTHSFNMNQRFLTNAFASAGSGIWNVTAPSSAMKCPPGYYMLFIIDQLGVPSASKILQIVPAQNPPVPEVLMVSPANGGHVEPKRPIKLAATIGNLSGAQVKFWAKAVGSSTWQDLGTTVSPYVLTWNQTALQQQEVAYKLKATALISGSSSDSIEITVTNNYYPTITSYSLTPGPAKTTSIPIAGDYQISNNEFYYYDSDALFDFNASAADQNGSIVRMEVTRRDGRLRVSNGSILPGSGDPSFSVKPRRGYNSYAITARDNLGLETVKEVRTMFFGGALDGTFNLSQGPDGTIYSVRVLADEKVLVGGAFGSINGNSHKAIARLNPDGTTDSTFTPNIGGIGLNQPTVYAIAVQNDGDVIMGGDFGQVGGQSRIRIARLNADGSLDSAFNPGTGVNGPVHAIATESNGKVLIGGAFTEVRGSARQNLARFNADGTLDSTFSAGVDGPVRVIVVQKNAQQNDVAVMIGGDFSQVGSNTRKRIAKLNLQGAVENFAPILAIPGEPESSMKVHAIAIQPDGNILIGGEFTKVNDVARTRVARLLADGSLDLDFNPVAPNGTVYAVGIQRMEKNNSGSIKILIGGSFTTLSGAHLKRIARLYSNGQMDWQSFRPADHVPNNNPDPLEEYGMFGGDVHAIDTYEHIFDPGRPEEDERLIVVGGSFTGYKVKSSSPVFGGQNIIRLVGE